MHEVWVLTNVEDRLSIEEAVNGVEAPNLHFYYIGLPKLLRPLLQIQGGHQFYYYVWQIKSYFFARTINKEVSFDLFHHITYGNDWMASYIGAFLPIPYIRGPGGGAHRTPRSLEKEYRLSGRLWEKVRSIGQWVFRHDPIFVRGQNRAGALLVCNKDSHNKLNSRWQDKAHLFPVSGVSSTALAITTATCDRDQRFEILSVGSLIRVKGFGLSIKAFNQFVSDHPKSHLTIIGSGPEEASLKKLVNLFDLENKVTFRQEMPHDQLMAEMANCHVLLFPSMRDGGGTVVVEAMSLGKPVICLDLAGPGMHITEECGIKVTPESPEKTVEDLCNALKKLHDDKDLQVRMGNFGKTRAENFYHWDRLGDRLYQIYRQVVS